jgi:hypothetical protein
MKLRRKESFLQKSLKFAPSIQNTGYEGLYPIVKSDSKKKVAVVAA